MREKYKPLRWLSKTTFLGRVKVGHMHCRFILLVLFGWGLTPVSAAERVSFNRDIRPILSDKCFACHGFDAKHRKAELRLDTAEGAHGKAESGVVVIKPGDLQGSELWRRILEKDAQEMMPPPETHKNLSEGEKDLIRRWIEAGASYEQHWSFVPPIRPTVPTGSGNAVDAFILEKLKSEGLAPSPETDKETLLRRVTLDLTGLPPTIEELNAFLAESEVNAYEKQVDRLLNSPRYGERMAVRWLDVARYGDTNGYLHDLLRTGWPWRDWVIKAFNEDKPFDQFVIEQVAGDLIPGAAQEQILATAFCRNHLITGEGGTLAAEYLNEYAADRVQTVGTAFLGLTFNCCRCHDHKFDPLKQDDFYSLQAYFNSITEKHLENNSASAYPPAIEIASPLAPQGQKVSVMVMQEAATPTPTFVLTRGQYDQPDKLRPVSRRPPQVLGVPLEGTSGDRLGLAMWLVSTQNPLLARVTVNRLWQQIFGSGIVKSLDDFGVQGDFPSHPELLDWLAVEFREGWSVRHMMRLLVTSSAYRQSSRVREDCQAKDPENRLLARFPRQRLTAEEIRDQALFSSGLLVEEMGGPPVFPRQPDGLWEERGNEGSNTRVYTPSQGPALYRRSLYTFLKRTAPPPWMSIFDAPDRTSCAVRRIPTNTPLQALAVLNEEQSLECAKFLAVRALQETGTNEERIKTLVRRVTSRTPTQADLQTLKAGLASLLVRYQTAPDEASLLLKQGTRETPADLNSNELAAWMLVASTVLNLDQTLVRD